MLEGWKERMAIETATRARIACGLVKGFRMDAKHGINLRKLYNEMTMNDEARTDLEDLREMIEESHARVDPEVRKKQLEEKARIEEEKRKSRLN